MLFEFKRKGKFAIGEMNQLYEQGYGEVDGSSLVFNLFEMIYLQEKKRIKLDKKCSINELSDKDLKRYFVYKKLRDEGYVVKDGLKFGVDFRVYEKFIKIRIKEEHSKYLVAVVDKINFEDFAAKVRVSNSTKKSLLIAKVDNEKDIILYKIEWFRP